MRIALDEVVYDSKRATLPSATKYQLLDAPAFKSDLHSYSLYPSFVTESHFIFLR